MLEDFVELSVARTAYLRVGDKENIIFFVGGGSVLYNMLPDVAFL